jgi:tetratricopeptide (TPR) repeat protein
VESQPELHRLNDDSEAFACERARALLAEGKLSEAEREADRAARTLEQGGEHWLLAEALTTQGVALARLSQANDARHALLRAAAVAERAGNTEQAGRALLAAVEELATRMLKDELCATYDRAARLLSSSPDVDALRRLSVCARRVLLLLDERATSSDWDNFSFREAVLRYESGIIGRALKDAGGVVSHAARLLGMKHHNNLISILNTRHRELLGERKPIIARRRSLMTHKKQ